MEEEKPDILVLVEVHTGNHTDVPEFPGYDRWCSLRPQQVRTFGGIVVYARKELRAAKAQFPEIDIRLEVEQCWITWHYKNARMTLAALYCPPTWLSKAEQDEWFATVTDRAYSASMKGDEVLMVGDFNAHWEHTPSGQPRCDYLGGKLSQMVETLEATVLNWHTATQGRLTRRPTATVRQQPSIMPYILGVDGSCNTW